MKIGPFGYGSPFYFILSYRVSGLKLFGRWIYSRVGNISCLSICGLARRWRTGGGNVSWTKAGILP